MGGDTAPKAEVEGAIRAAKSLDVHIILVGREDVVNSELAQHREARKLPIEVVHASEQVTMQDGAARALRTKRDSSIRVASRLVHEGKAQGWVSAGNTGAIMATAKMVHGVLPGVDRPALASAFPTLRGTPSVMIDVGANVDCSPRMLAQFAVMGDIYARILLRHGDPRVALLSIGEEEHKGNDLTRSAAPLMKSLPLNFIGNVEGRDLFTGAADVIVCDGFTGNVALKVSEGMAEVVRKLLQDSLKVTLKRQIGYLLSRPAFRDFRKKVDYTEYGGAPLLGIRGVCIICHGRSNGMAVKNAVRLAAEFVEARITQRIETELSAWAASMETVKVI
jgi:glycerol-3-phosphate acyltransferase PlsX